MKIINDNIEELNKIVEQYPLEIPVEVMARFLHWKVTTVRAAIETGNFPGIYIQPTLNGRKTYKILTVPFYMYYTKGV